MARDSVETVRDFLRAFADRGLDRIGEYWAEDIDWRAIEGALHGLDAVRRYAQDWSDLFDDLTNDPVQLKDLGDGRVVTEQQLSGRAKLSGVKTELRYAVVYAVCDGKITRGREYTTFEEALDAASARRE